MLNLILLIFFPTLASGSRYCALLMTEIELCPVFSFIVFLHPTQVTEQESYNLINIITALCWPSKILKAHSSWNHKVLTFIFLCLPYIYVVAKSSHVICPLFKVNGRKSFGFIALFIYGEKF